MSENKVTIWCEKDHHRMFWAVCERKKYCNSKKCLYKAAKKKGINDIFSPVARYYADLNAIQEDLDYLTGNSSSSAQDKGRKVPLQLVQPEVTKVSPSTVSSLAKTIKRTPVVFSATDRGDIMRQAILEELSKC